MNPNEEEIRIPKDLTDRLEDALCAAILSEQGMQCLKEERRKPALTPSIPHLTPLTVPSNSASIP